MGVYAEAVDAHELDELQAQWGPFALERHALAVDEPFLSHENQQLTRPPRRAEVCYILHRGDPTTGVLLHIKRFYPAGAFRLPTGGIHAGETVLATLAREIYEETGQTVGAGPGQVVVERFLGVVAYNLAHGTWGRTERFATYHFLARMPADGVLAPQDADEQIAGWQWRPVHELVAAADYLEQVGGRYPDWADWGRYRALSHRFVARHMG